MLEHRAMVKTLNVDFNGTGYEIPYFLVDESGKTWTMTKVLDFVSVSETTGLAMVLYEMFPWDNKPEVES